MVNTFLVSAGPDGFEKTAEVLDRKRLFRQIVEAYEILRVLTSRHHIASLLGAAKCPSFSGTAESAEALFDWARSVSSQYIESGIVYTVNESDELESRPATEAPYHLRQGDRFHENGDGTLTLWPTKAEHDRIQRKYNAQDPAVLEYDLSAGKRLRTRKALLLAANRWVPNSWIVYGKGHCYHPACLMWVGYERALMRYMTVMHTTYQLRYPQYEISPLEYYVRVPACEAEHLPESDASPWWYTSDSPVILSHRASLLRKLPTAYSKVVKASDWDERGYYWPASRGMVKWNKLFLSEGADAAAAGCAAIANK